MYCEQCGARHEPGSKFCAECGTPIPQPSANFAAEYIPSKPAPASPPGGNGEIVLVLAAQRKESFFKRKACYLVFMKDKLIVAHLSAQRQKEENARISSELKAQGKGFFKGSVAMMQHWANYHTKYYSMTPGHILAEDSTNFTIQYTDIKKLVFRCESTDIDVDGGTSSRQGKLSIALFDGKKIEFSHTFSHNSAIKKTLVDLFGKTLNYKK
ncbi:MAG: zinc-ribbon domain-containing protein [Oscillospiraceae bacterium]|jgi:hypothetical protein